MLTFHIDLNSVALKRETISSLLHFLAACGYDSILWEVEDKVRWETCPECVHPDAFTKDEFRDILDEAAALGLQPIPLLQTFGHGEYVLACEKYIPWRELPEYKDCYCVSRQDVRAFLARWIDEYLDLFGAAVKFFHLGGDEAYSFGKCDVCSKRDRMELYAEHLVAVSGELRRRGIRPGIWCDMILAGDDEKAVANIPKDFVIWHWDYYYGCSGRPKSKWSDKTRFLQENGYDVVFCAASQCGGESPFITRYGWRSENVIASAELVREDKMLGLCVTSWSVRGAPKALQYPVAELAAVCYRSAGIDGKEAFERLARRHFGDVSAQTLCDLTDWDYINFASIEGRGWTRYKDASIPTPGRWTVVMADADGKPESEPGSRSSRIAATEAMLAKMKAAEATLRAARHRTALADLLARGAELNIRLLESALAATRGEPVPPAPCLATADYYGLEQTDLSAINFARLVWAVMDERFAEVSPLRK